MDSIKPIYVSGYVRNKKIKKTDTSNMPGTILVTIAVISILAVYWKLTLSIAMVVSLVVFAKKYYQFINNPSRLIVNYYGVSTARTVWNNITEMVREG